MHVYAYKSVCMQLHMHEQLYICVYVCVGGGNYTSAGTSHFSNYSWGWEQGLLQIPTIAETMKWCQFTIKSCKQDKEDPGTRVELNAMKQYIYMRVYMHACF